MQRSSAVATTLVAVVLGLVVPSCAQGNPNPAAEVSADVTPAASADGGADASCTLGAVEVCNGKDDNCDGRIDEGFDVDGDGFFVCAHPGKPADCNDNDPAIHPGATEICNGKDDNCDGKIDEGFDKDNDGFFTCAHGTTAVDCDDNDPAIHPGAVEICNGKDDDCNGKIDELPAKLTGSLTAPVNAHWAVAGSGSIVDGWARLTPEGAFYQAGALWWNAPYLFDTFDVNAQFWIQNKADGGDGLTFAWLPVNGVTAVGAAGPGFGVGGFGGYAVAIDTFQNAGEPVVPSLALVKASATPETLARSPIPNVRDALNHRLRVKLAAGKVSVWIDGVNYIFEFQIPGYAPYVGRWGFTGATGTTATEAHWVQDVTMSFPDGQGCVP